MYAEPMTYDLDINYKCPNCRCFFRLRNTEIPTDKVVIRKCDCCKSKIKIRPVDVNILTKDATKIVNNILSELGWKKKEIDEMKQKAIDYIRTNDESVLLKIALSHGPST